MLHGHRLLIAALALGALAGCDGGGTTIDAGPRPDAYVERGRIALTWTISDQGTAIDCSDVHADSVTVLSEPAGGGTFLIDAFPCTQGQATTSFLPEGSYLVSVELSSTEGLLDEIALGSVTVGDQQNVPLTADFEVVRRGNFEFQIDSSAPGLNCTADEFGAGITEMLLELQDPLGTCVPGVVFDVAAGGSGSAAFTYTSDCTDARHACIENDQLVTVTGVSPSGPHALLILGFEGDLACYGTQGSEPLTNDFTIPGADLTRDLGTLPLPIDTTSGTCVEP